MPITQERIRDLLVEYKQWLDTIDSLVADAATREQSGQTTQAKYIQLVADVERLRRCHRHYFTVEWRDLNRNWKRNQRQAAKMEAKRRRQGVAPRKDYEGIKGDFVPRGILSLSPEQQREEEIYRRFCAGEGADEMEGGFEGDFLPLAPPPQNDEMDKIRCQYELGLANAPTEEQLEAWRNKKQQEGI